MTSKFSFRLALKGFAIGTADIIPGVSGGTIAFISGIYQRLISAIADLGPQQVLALFQLLTHPSSPEKRHAFVKSITGLDWQLFLSLGVGLGCAIATMARVMPFLLDNYPFAMNSLFFGLILFSITIPLRETEKRPVDFLVIAVSAGVSLLAMGEPSGEPGSTHPAFLFLSGSLAICSMILPGISGSYVLILLGEYKIVLNAVREHDLGILVPFLLGIAVGITLFTRVLKYLLKHYRSLTMAALVGFLLGSLKILWPGNHSAEFLVETEPTLISCALIVLGVVALWSLDRLTPPESSE